MIHVTPSPHEMFANLHACMRINVSHVTVLSNMPLCMLYICFLLGFKAFWTCEIKLILSYLVLSVTAERTLTGLLYDTDCFIFSCSITVKYDL